MTPLGTVWDNVIIRSATGGDHFITAAANWVPDDPHVVRLLLSTSEENPVCWMFSRTDLLAGLDGPLGCEGGDWMLLPDLSRPDGEGVELVLAVAGRGVGRQAAVCLDVAAVRDFLDATFDAIPAGQEPAHSLDELTGGAA